MSHYIHHVPGRLRIRCESLRLQNASRQNLLRSMQAISGVHLVKLNPKAASITVCYDAQTKAHEEALEMVQNLGNRSTETTPKRLPSTASKTLSPANRGLAKEVGKIAFNVLISRGVTYSISSLLGARGH